jgi:hypothetical protein
MLSSYNYLRRTTEFIGTLNLKFAAPYGVIRYISSLAMLKILGNTDYRVTR